MPEYELTTFAEDDLKSIARYTLDTWGLEQAKRYERVLVTRFHQIAKGHISPRASFHTDRTSCLPIVNITTFSIVPVRRSAR